MNKYTGFSDLCVPYTTSVKDLKEILLELAELGYRNVAIEQVYDHAANTPGGKKGDQIPAPVDLTALTKELQGKLRLLNRLTIVYQDPSIAFVVSRSPNVRRYNLIAVVPTTSDAFQHACQTMTCDIISYNPDTARGKMSRKYYFLAVERSIMFEIKYAPTIVSSTDRKDAINRAHRYHAYGKSKNVVISSGARNRFQVRGPYDIANLGLIFGLSEEQSKNAILALPRMLLIAADARRFSKAGIVVLRRHGAMVDSDEYSESELNEAIVTTDEEKDDASGDDAQSVDLAPPPKKMAKYDK